MTVEVAGSAETTAATNPRIAYADAAWATSYVVERERSRITVRREAGQVVIRDLVSGVHASGETYLDALWAFDRLRRPPGD